MPRLRRPAALRLADVPRQPWYPALSTAMIAAVAIVEITMAHLTSPTVVVTAAAAVVPLAWRHRRPWLAAAATAAALINFLVQPALLLCVGLAGATGLYATARNRLLPPAVLTATGIGAAVLVNLGHLALGAYNLDGARPELGAEGSLSYFAESFVLACAITATVVLADSARSREQHRRERDAAQRRLVALERRAAAAAERARIARELHDIVAHTVSVIAVQAEMHRHTIPDLSADARDGFQSIATSARDSLAELRSLVDVLREKDGTAATTPQPTLADLTALLKAHRAAGGTVEPVTTGPRPRVTAAVGLAAYRIVQEALTNIRRHAPGAHATCRIDYAPRHIRVHVANTAPSRPPACRPGNSHGYGLDGMRERATLLGGHLDWYPTSDGGFVVTALLPVTAPDAAVRAFHPTSSRPARSAGSAASRPSRTLDHWGARPPAGRCGP
ncbi:sensor histidine kinase [Salinispora oceanensis]|uniref:sensor histidine kinase n=1 Tax=Salinispora oceanensis TaxID=1050199 RepID=UPI001CC3446F|nr:histidine kinase [Salinispora oceanensis]